MAEYRIDELARAAGTTVRNVRAYQQRGLLPPARRAGRAGVFGDEHVARLKLVAQLLDRGYTLANIGELIAAWENGHGIDELLGLDVPEYVSIHWLRKAFPSLADEELPAALADALSLGILEPAGDRFRVTNPRLLSAATELTAAGVPQSAMTELARLLQAEIEVIASRFVDLVEHNLFANHTDALPTPAEAERLVGLVQRLRPLADMVVLGELNQALEHETRRRLQAHLDRLLQ